jgi:hypothetical protein
MAGEVKARGFRAHSNAADDTKIIRQRVPRTDAKRPSDAPRVCSEAFAGQHCVPHP